MYDLTTLTEWVAMAENSTPEELKQGVVRRFLGFRIVETTKAKVATGEGEAGIDVHLSLALGENYYGVTRISGHAMETIHKPLGSAGTEDPLNQRQSQGWKATFTAVRLNENFAARLEHAVTA
jgi:N4-gp56 family major capsid protein